MDTNIFYQDFIGRNMQFLGFIAILAIIIIAIGASLFICKSKEEHSDQYDLMLNDFNNTNL